MRVRVCVYVCEREREREQGERARENEKGREAGREPVKLFASVIFPGFSFFFLSFFLD